LQKRIKKPFISTTYAIQNILYGTYFAVFNIKNFIQKNVQCHIVNELNVEKNVVMR
jgi:hypothetical protein